MPIKNEINLDKIPDGIYCYRPTGKTKKIIVEGFGDEPIDCREVEYCPYFGIIESILGFCSLLKEEIEDACKICDYNFHDEEEWYQ